jgi:hypothetical protein
MINQETVKKIQHASIAERIQMIELILQSLKHDIPTKKMSGKPLFKPFKLRKFSLGKHVDVDRDTMYSERNF